MKRSDQILEACTVVAPSPGALTASKWGDPSFELLASCPPPRTSLLPSLASVLVASWAWALDLEEHREPEEMGGLASRTGVFVELPQTGLGPVDATWELLPNDRRAVWKLPAPKVPEVSSPWSCWMGLVPNCLRPTRLDLDRWGPVELWLELLAPFLLVKHRVFHQESRQTWCCSGSTANETCVLSTRG